MKANICAAIAEASAVVDAEGESAQHATNLEDMLDVIEAAGSINMEGECAKTLLTLDQATEISALDARITHLKLQRAAKDTFAETAEGGDGGVNQLTKLGILKLLVPPFVSIVKCERARRRLLAAPPSETKLERNFAEAMREMITNSRSFEASEVGTIAPAKANFLIWKSSSCMQLRNAAKSSYAELRAEATQIQGMLFDLDRLSKPANAEECIETLRKWGGKVALMMVLKSFQGASGRGVKHFEFMTATLGCAGISTPGPEMQGLDGVELPLAAGGQGQKANKKYETLQQEFVKIRQSARLQLSLRSASIIIYAKDAAAVAAFERDIKPLKVTIPKAIKEKLAALNK